ncbi:MAG TPA: BamA/TamA family outer membrane protein [Sphingobacteriaceae bacterium]
MIFSGCRSPRFLSQDQALVTKVSLDSVDKQFREQAYLYVQNDIRPNSRISLFLYNLFNTRNGSYRTDRIKAVGESPHVLDSTLVEISRKQIERYLFTKGFFNARVKSDISIRNQRARIVFTADQGPEFTIREIGFKVPDPEVAKLYEGGRPGFSRLKTGQRYDRDTLEYEQEQVYQLMRRNGYFDYLRQYMHVDVDTNLYSSEADLLITINNPAGKSAHQVYTIDDSFITIRNSEGRRDTANAEKTVVDSQYHFIDYSGKIRSRPISKYIFIEKGSLYSINRENLTYDRLYDLNIFRNIRIDYRKAADSSNRLFPQYDMVPLKQMSNRIEGEYTFNAGRNGFNIGDTYTNRNIFGGAEQLEVKVRYGILFESALQGRLSQRVFNQDFQIGASMVFPRLLVPFPLPVYSRAGIPHTTISTSYQAFDQRDAFTNRTFINSITYDWTDTKVKFHSLTPLNLEYRNGRLDPDFRRRLEDEGYELYVRTNERRYFSLGSIYSFTFNAIRLNSYDDFIYFRGTADVAGNTLAALDKVLNFKRENNFKTIFGVPYLQYLKTEVDVRKYDFLGGEQQFIARLSGGIGYPHGNNKVELPDGTKRTALFPFEKSFFAGGSTGIRAWQARTLGPGSYNRAVIGSDTLRRNLRNIDQVGEIKIEGNLEYRFKLANNIWGAKVKGALFTDFGNIWRIRETLPENPGGEFKFDKFFKEIAIGTGAGLRFDLNYFVLRLDAGIKVKDPQFSGTDQWVIRHFFDKKDFQRNYAVTNSPDVYRFVVYNFGIGMPF